MPAFFTHFFVLLFMAITLNAEAVDAPKSLDEWKPWVLEKHPDINCPFEFNQELRTCVWPSELHIDVNNKGATFSLQVENFKNDWVSLPGNTGFWPENIADNNTKISVRDKAGTPEIYLATGSHRINGELHWNDMPRTIAIPQNIGLIQLTLNGKTVIAPAIENGDQLWLANNEPQSAATHQDTLNIRVFRKIDDEIPIKITTRLQLDISGKEREIQLGQLLLDGFTPIEFSSALPAHIEKNGSLRIQAKSGHWEITLISQSITPINKLSYKVTNEPWPQEEIWVFEAQRQLRSVQISGVQSVDPQQTQLPSEWKNLPAYLVTPQTYFTLDELRRGENKETTNNLQLKRSAWLSFDGKRFIFGDDLQGEFHNSRIEMIKPIELTNANINNTPQLITRVNNNQNAGIEIREQNLDIKAVSQVLRSTSIPVSGWNQDINKVSTELYLPPGWSLLTATGVSSEYGSWVSKWTLWDMFAVFIIVVAFARITTPLIGVVAAITFVLIYSRTGAPIFIWLNLIAVIALTKLVSGSFKDWLLRYGYLSFLTLALITLPFTIREARIMINPQLENEDFWVVSSSMIMMQSSDNKKSARAYKPAPAAYSKPVQEMDLKQEAEGVVDAISAEDIGKMPDASVADSLQRITPIAIKKNYDPSQQTQTGIALPTYYDNRVNLTWDGPVKADETTSLILIPPFINKLGHFLAIFLPLIMAGILLQLFLASNNKKLMLPAFLRKTVPVITSCFLISCLSIATPDTAQADVTIDAALLKELENRLTAPPKCLPDCAAIEKVDVTIKQDQLTLEMIVHASDLISLPLPADHEQWWPMQVTVDGKNAALVQTANQILLASLSKGRHSLTISTNLLGKDAINLQFPVQLHNVHYTTTGWELSGLPTDTQSSQSLQLQRVERDQNANKAEHLRPDAITPFVIVKRELDLDLEWTVTTIVTRVAPAFGAINLEIPLLEGESPLTTQRNTNDKISVHLEANQSEFEWRSTIKQINPLQLQAEKNVPWVEIWSLHVSSIWHTQTKGIAPVQMGKNENIPVWQPWPGETLSVDIHRPQATPGSHVTIDRAELNFQPGNRNSINELVLDIRTNQGGQYTFSLPQHAQLEKLEINRTEQLISAAKGVLKIPLGPGSQHVLIRWKQDQDLGIFMRSPVFSLEQGSSNQSISIELPNNRWPIWASGPMMGPSILLWGLLLVISVVAYVLGRTTSTPLKPYEWVLLSLGISTLSMSAFVLVAIWLLALSKRGQLTSVTQLWKFKLLQVSLFVLSFISLSVLITTLPDGLLSTPDMHILGNNSYANHFRWYQDYSDSEFPSAWIISLPLWCYKVIILLWALWLATALLRWLRWGWQQLSYQGLWHASDTIVKKPEVIVVQKNEVQSHENLHNSSDASN